MESQYHRFASITPRTYLLLEFRTSCLDMMEDRNEKSTLVYDGWSSFFDAASDLPRASYSKGKSITWFVSLLEEEKSAAILHNTYLGSRGGPNTLIFTYLPTKRGTVEITLAAVLPSNAIFDFRRRLTFRGRYMMTSSCLVCLGSRMHFGGRCATN